MLTVLPESGGSATGPWTIQAWQMLTDGTYSSFSFFIGVDTCDTPTITSPTFEANHYASLGESEQYEVPEFTLSDITGSCTLSYQTSISASVDTTWLSTLSSERGVSWDTSDLDTAKIGTYTVTVTASAGCSSQSLSYYLEVTSNPCNEDVLDTLSSNVDFGEVTYYVSSGQYTFHWTDNEVKVGTDYDAACGELEWTVADASSATYLSLLAEDQP